MADILASISTAITIAKRLKDTGENIEDAERQVVRLATVKPPFNTFGDWHCPVCNKDYYNK